MQEKFLISFGACQVASADALNLQCGGESCLTHAFNRSFVQGCVPHDAAASNVSAIELKLRLHQN